MRTYGGSEAVVSGGTSVSINQAALRARGATIEDAAVTVDNMVNYMDQGWQIFALFHDNNRADPDVNGPYHHYSDIYDHYPGGWQFANPWGGRDIGYGDAQTRAALEYVFAVRWNVSPPVPVEDDSFVVLAA